MDRRIKISRHGVEATLLCLAPAYWRIAIDDGRGGQFEHQGSRGSAENRAGWECWCYQRMCENPPLWKPEPTSGTGRAGGLLSAYFDLDRPSAMPARA
jgi:hypothetical protein